MNALFYANEFAAPGAGKIEDILRYSESRLESCHCYIQWLFPMSDSISKFNAHTSLLTEEEAHTIRMDTICSTRVLHAFERFLFFMGLRLCKKTRTIYRASAQKLAFINSSPHNFLRITRILKSMLLLGLGSLQKPFLDILYYETLHGCLGNARRSMTDHWLPTQSDDFEDNCIMHNIFAENMLIRMRFICDILHTTESCRFACILLLREIGKLSIPFSDVFVLISKNNDNYFGMDTKTASLKWVSKNEFSTIYCTQGDKLDDPQVPGLYIWETIDDDIDIDLLLDMCCVKGGDKLAFVFFCS